MDANAVQLTKPIRGLYKFDKIEIKSTSVSPHDWILYTTFNIKDRYKHPMLGWTIPTVKILDDEYHKTSTESDVPLVDQGYNEVLKTVNQNITLPQLRSVVYGYPKATTMKGHHTRAPAKKCPVKVDFRKML